MGTISLCMIVKNEELFIERCLKSVQNFVNEIVIVDTGSTDNTVSIAERYTESVYHKEFTNDFSEMRNYAISLCQSDWILFLDADEFFSDQDLILLKKIFTNGLEEKCGGIKFYIYNFFNTGGWYTGHVLRMIRNNLGFEYRRPFGERIEPSVVEKGYTLLEPDIMINHTGHSKNLEYRFSKTNKYIEICKKQIEDKTADSLVYSYLGINYRNNGELKLAYEMTKKGVENNPQSFLAHSFYGSVLRSLNKNTEAIFEYSEATKKAPKIMKGVMENNIGIIYLSEGSYEHALNVFKNIYKDCSHLIHVKLNMGLAYYFMGNYEKALESFDKVIKRNAYFTNYDNKALLECEPWKCLSYETIYGYPGLQFFINESKRKLERCTDGSIYNNNQQ